MVNIAIIMESSNASLPNHVEDPQPTSFPTPPLHTSHVTTHVTTVVTPLTDNTRVLLEVQSHLYTDMNAILQSIYQSGDARLICRQFRMQNIIQKHFIAMRDELNVEIRKAAKEATRKRSWWKRL